MKRLYERLGPNYPVAVIAAGLLPIYVVFLGSLGILILYAPSLWTKNSPRNYAQLFGVGGHFQSHDSLSSRSTASFSTWDRVLSPCCAAMK